MSPSYELRRDAAGLTEREREALVKFSEGHCTPSALAVAMSPAVTRQRAAQLLGALEEKGALVREPSGTLTLAKNRRGVSDGR